MPVEGIAAKRPPRKLSPNLLAIRAHQVASAAEPVPIREGTMIGDYSVKKRLDEGGMGTVYAAVHPVIGKKVAIKVLHPHVARQEEAVARFIQEARAVNAIGHPGIVDIFGFGRFVDGRHYITMEYLEGQQLLAYLNERGPIPPLDMLSVARQLAESLAAAHDKGVVHRDMKPENVFLGVDPKAEVPTPWPPRTKILDFGLAKLIEAEFDDKKPRTRAGVTVGTPYYMAPEQCRGKEIDRRADVYALGVMMYEMVTGRVPFYAAESVDVLYMHLTQEPEAPSSHRPVPPEIEALILRCMSKSIEERPQDMHQLLAELDAVIDALVPKGESGKEIRAEHELKAEADAFFGGAAGPEPTEQDAAAAARERRNRTTIPMPAEGFAPPGGAADDDAGSEVQLETDRAVTKESPAIPAIPASPATDAPAVPAPVTAPTAGAPALASVAPQPVKTYSTPAGHGVPSLPTPPVGALVEADLPPPIASEPELLLRPLQKSKSPAPDGLRTAITMAPTKPARAPVALWVAVILQGIAILVLAVLLIARSGSDSGGAGAGTPSQGTDQGAVELRSPAPVDVSLGGRVLARKVRRLVVTRLPAGSTQVFELRQADGRVRRVSVKVTAGRTVSASAPAQ